MPNDEDDARELHQVAHLRDFVSEDRKKYILASKVDSQGNIKSYPHSKTISSSNSI